ncbi:MAG: NADH-quinone oxidoreductase subunit NuoF [candidate division Zixibacteria bacterium]|nr:NADH-quinone oxidoreductase subunit NuoF [candidate division Zixibacteria bacterium]
MQTKILTEFVTDPQQHRIETAVSRGAYQAWEKVVREIAPDDLIELVKKSGIRGRGGAGFPAGVKWGFVPRQSPKPKYLCCNADESEPGTCKDRVLLENDPHRVIEGMAICSFAIESHQAFVYIRGEFVLAARRMQAAIDEAYQRGYLGKNIFGSGYDLDMVVHRGGGAYICGEETALLNSLEGDRGVTRIRPPFPAVEGLYGCPTVVNNVETLSALPSIVNRGADWWAQLGTEKSTGTKLFSLSGHVKRPGNYEVEMGYSLKNLIYEKGGGILDDKKLKVVIPGGSSTPMLTPDKIDTPLDFESVVTAGSMLGSGAVIVIHEETCIVWVTELLAHFYAHESCGKCTPCREGTQWMYEILRRIEHGRGTMEDIDTLLDLADNIEGNTICPLGDAAAVPVISSIKQFRDEYIYHIEHKKCLVKSDFRLR